jgi:hypothetical protein
MKIANLPRQLAESTWSPFQSPEVRDICNHLSRQEKVNLLAHAAEYGRQYARVRGYSSEGLRMYAWPWSK